MCRCALHLLSITTNKDTESPIIKTITNHQEGGITKNTFSNHQSLKIIVCQSAITNHHQPLYPTPMTILAMEIVKMWSQGQTIYKTAAKEVDGHEKQPG